MIFFHLLGDINKGHSLETIYDNSSEIFYEIQFRDLSVRYIFMLKLTLEE